VVADFYELYENSVQRWARQQREPLLLARLRARHFGPSRRIAHIAEALHGSCRIWLARVHGRPAAAIIVLKEGNAQYTRGVMDKDLAGPTGANFLLHHLAIEDAERSGCRYYHMGETRPASPLAKFKAHFGARPHHYAEYRVERWPLTRVDLSLRHCFKAAIGFRDA
jgi:hypothetical protein